MRGGTFVHRFGLFEFDPATGRLFHGSTIVRLPEPQSAMLRTLIAQAGQVVTQDALIQAGWGTVAVTSDSVRQSISRLRKTLGAMQGGVAFIETIPNRGYRFAEPLQIGARDDPPAPDGVVLAAHRAFLQGRADLLTLKLDKILSARTEFEQALAIKPDYVEAHIGLANACALIFEASRADTQTDLHSLQRAIHHARHATVLAQSSGDAWSTLAFARGLQGDAARAALAASRAIELEPAEWMHRLRLAYISWGDKRVRAASAVLRVNPGLALAHWLIATVLVARGAFRPALDELADGCQAQDQQSLTTGSVPAVGLHLLRGLVLAALHQMDEAVEEFQRELSCVSSGQLYARQCAANTWYALGAIHLRQRRREAADAAFLSALDAAPGHPFALAALGRPIPVARRGDPRVMDTAIARAVVLARAGRHGDAALAYQHAISNASPNAGWLLPVEPLINVTAHPDVWSDVLAVVRQHAI